MVAVGACHDGPEYDYAKDVNFRVYASGDGEEAGAVVYNGKCEQDTLIQVERRGERE